MFGVTSASYEQHRRVAAAALCGKWKVEGRSIGDLLRLSLLSFKLLANTGHVLRGK